MSKYTTYSTTEFRNLEVLLAALAALGWDKGKVEVHDTAQQLYGYQGDRRAEKAHVVIRRQHTGIGMSNDIGFERQADGTYRAIVSKYDSALGRYGQRSGNFVESVKQQYGKIAGDKAINTVLQTTIPRLKASGAIPRHATATTVKAGKTTKIVLRY